MTPVGALPRAKRFTVVGVFEAGAQEYDLGLALVHLSDAQRLGRMGEGVTGVRLKLTDMWEAWPVARDLSDRMEGYYRVRDWGRDHANFFARHSPAYVYFASRFDMALRMMGSGEKKDWKSYYAGLYEGVDGPGRVAAAIEKRPPSASPPSSASRSSRPWPTTCGVASGPRRPRSARRSPRR